METLRKTKDFRKRHSKEKLEIAKRLLGKGDFSHAFAEAYLSIFYSARLLLLDKNEDSDDISKILELSHTYFEPYEWLSVNLREILQQGKILHDKVTYDPSAGITEGSARKFVEYADLIFREIQSEEKQHES